MAASAVASEGEVEEVGFDAGGEEGLEVVGEPVCCFGCSGDVFFGVG